MTFEQAAANYEGGHLREAWDACVAVFDQHRPDHRLLHLMGLIAYRQQHFAQAKSLIEQAAQLFPDEPLYFCNLALPLFALGDFEKGIEQLDLALALNPAFLPALEQKSAALMQLNRAREALPLLQQLASKEPSPRRVMSKALCLRSLGKLDASRADLSAMLARNPGCGQGWWLLAGMSRASRDANHLLAMGSALATNMTAHDKVPLLFALAREHEDLGDFDKAFDFYQKANALRRRGLHYDIGKDEALFSGISRHDTGNALPHCAPGRDPRAKSPGTPVFVVSMPRTGSTLVERILGAHSQVCAAGELQLIGRLVNVYSSRRGKPYPDSIPDLTPDDCAGIRADYLSQSRQWRDGAPLFVDKMPVNFLYLGIIARAFPEAPIVHVYRDPMDTCLSCFRQLFGDLYQFTYDLEELGRWYGMYRGLMAHWERVMPGRVLDLEYENLVRNPEGQARQLLTHCGLDWEPSCLEFKAGGSAVRTPSAEQVRRDVYQDSVGRWRSYAQHLQPLRKALGDFCPADGESRPAAPPAGPEPL